jgi:hypothetical protein
MQDRYMLVRLQVVKLKVKLSLEVFTVQVFVS